MCALAAWADSWTASAAGRGRQGCKVTSIVVGSKARTVVLAEG